MSGTPLKANSAAPRWTVVTSDALDTSADVLICPANVFLTLSGGVGGEVLLRHGDGMQRELRAWLHERNLRFVPQGTVVPSQSHGTPFQLVLHAVAVDGFYQSSPDMVRFLVERCLAEASARGHETVVLTALATGYGHLAMTQFGMAIAPLVGPYFGSVRQVTVCVRKSHEANAVRLAISSSE